MSAKKEQSPEDIKLGIVEAALALAAEQGWEYTTLRDISARSGIDFAQMRAHIDDKNDILVIFGRMVDRKVLASIGKGDDEASARDRLFDLLMERFDVLNDHRAGLVAILDSFKLDPKQAVISMPHLCKSMSWMLEVCGVETSGIKGAVKVAGLSAIYLKTLNVWKNDEGVDMPKTMAALDSALARVEGWAETLGF